ncbi:hypothetical protein BKA93DRAFT_753062 [Sparassis latifolia]
MDFWTMSTPPAKRPSKTTVNRRGSKVKDQTKGAHEDFNSHKDVTSSSSWSGSGSEDIRQCSEETSQVKSFPSSGLRTVEIDSRQENGYKVCIPKVSYSTSGFDDQTDHGFSAEGQDRPLHPTVLRSSGKKIWTQGRRPPRGAVNNTRLDDTSDPIGDEHDENVQQEREMKTDVTSAGVRIFTLNIC